MKKGETTEFKEAQQNMQRVFNKIQQSPALKQAYAKIQNGSMSSEENNMSMELVNLALTLNHYIERTKNMPL